MAGTTITPVALFGPITLTTAAAPVYTVPGNSTVTINRIAVNNATTGSVGLQVWVVRGGSSTTTGNQMIGTPSTGQAISAGPSEPYIINALASTVMNSGDAIFMEASTPLALNAIGSGWSQ